MIEIADKSFRVLKFFTLPFHEVTEIIEKAAHIEEFYWYKVQTDKHLYARSISAIT